jgi:proteasome lid subunit RPN8/RPN11
MFQWLLSTYHAAGGVGDPMYASFQTQAVIAVGWHHSHPTGQWPVCGE